MPRALRWLALAVFLGIGIAFLELKLIGGGSPEALLWLANGSVLALLLFAAHYRHVRTAADALREKARYYQSLADHSGDLLIRLDRDGSARFVSRASRRLLGCHPDTLMGHGLIAHVHPGDVADFVAAVRRTQSTGETNCTFRIKDGVGDYRWVEARCRLTDLPRWTRPPLQSPAGWSHGGQHDEAFDLTIIATLRDIHDRKLAEQRAANSAARLSEANNLLVMAEELASLGHWAFDPIARTIHLSQEAALMAGLDSRDVELDELWALLEPKDRHGLLRRLVLAGRQAGPTEATVRVRQGEELRTLQLKVQRNGDEEAGALFGVVSDITDKLAGEQRLVAALHEARSAAAFRSQFLATMSHEIRTPMTGVIGMIELLATEPSSAERALYLETLRHSAELMMAVLNDILDFSKVDAGRLTIQNEPFDLGATLLTTLRLFDRTASARGLSLRLDGPDPGAVWLRGDAVRLRQVLSNLLSNAIKFSERGEIVLRASLFPRRTAAPALTISVEDQGQGISPALCERLFEPFVQGDDNAAEGTGLGLAISRRLVHAMGGSIAVSSREGHGSTFTLLLGLPTAEATEGEGGVTARTEPARPLDILLAEDNPVNQLLVTALCRRMGHRVIVAPDGEAAIVAASRRRFDLILMDMQMPRCDGLTAARRIRTYPGPSAKVPIIALTADAAAARRPLYAEAGIDGLLAKPVDSGALGMTLSRIADGAPPRPDGEPGPLPHGILLDRSILDEVEALLGPAKLRTLVDLLDDELDRRPRAIRAALADGEARRAASEAHSLKGAAGNLGAVAVRDAAAAIEEVSSHSAEADGPVQGLAVALADLDRAAAETRRALALLPLGAAPAEITA